MRKFAAMITTNSATMPPAEYQRTSLLLFMRLSCPLVADDYAGREEREADHGGEVNDVAEVDHAALEAFEVRHHRKGRDDLNHHRIDDARQQIGDRGVAGEDQEEADHDRQNEADHLVTRHGGGH